ncbi:MAG: ABC transporter ATP-binding protein [Kineosporiaceae bacterium]
MDVSTGPVVSTRHLTKAYGRCLAVHELDLRIEAGEVFGYLGPNGAGKTTTIRLLMGLLRPTSGRAFVLGLDAWQASVAVHRQVGYLPGEPAVYDRLTGRQHVDYFRSLRAMSDEKYALALAERLDLELGKPARSLSKGNRQKLALVLALMTRPSLLVLDEPTSGLDPMVQQEFHALLREHRAEGGSVLLSSHVLAEVQRVADRIGVLRAGRLVAVERLEDLRRKSLHHITARFAAPVAREDLLLPDDVRDVVIDGETVTFSAPQSALDGVLKQVARWPVVDFGCVEAELEETFLAYYGEATRGAA